MSELEYIQKGKKTVNNQYRYVSHDQVTAAIHPLLVKHGIAVIPSIIEAKQEGNRTCIDLNVFFVNADTPADMFCVRSVGYGVDAGDKGPGKAISYAFKMACLKTFCLETGEDSDHDQSSVYEPVKCLQFDLLIPATFTEAEKKKLNKFLTESAEAHGKHVEEVKEKAAANMDNFLDVFKKWNTGKK